eukprot:TRINITY_DN2449_c0_g1_i7.p1 TRINITY_DN2449_c0_g1~~TRINITY_DN2449_c0_g1_i7.p1  ORF type:complete len:898 (+),score=146.49 TRINITY_DN2449_c0_g1_i7:52-2745(+)
MSEILQKTFKVLLGGGEGVSWSLPSASSPHSLSPALANTLRHLALVAPKDEAELCRRQIEQCSSILTNPDSTPSSLAESIVRVMFIDLMGHDVSSLHIHAVKLAQASNLLHRKLGYLACSLLLPGHSDLRIMLTNSLIRDLSDKSCVPALVTGLVATCNIVTDPSVLPVFLDQVIKLTAHKNYLVRTKALITLEKFCDLSPSLWCWRRGEGGEKDVQNTVITALSDQDPTVVSTAIQILSKKLVQSTILGDNLPSSPESDSCDNDSIIGPLLHVYKQIHESRFPRDFVYKGLAAPWTQVHIMRCLSSMNSTINSNARSVVAVTEIFQNVLGLEFSKETIVQVLISEAIKAVGKLDCLKPFLSLAIKNVSKFLQSKNNQVKYCGLDLLQQLFQSRPPVLTAPQEDNVIFCFEHPDLPIQIKTLNLLISIINKENHEKILNSILVYMKKTGSSNDERRLECVEENVPKIHAVVNKFCDSLDYTVDSLLRLIQCSRDHVQRDLVEHLKLLISSSQSTHRNSSKQSTPEHLADNFQTIDLASEEGYSEAELTKVQLKFCQLMHKLVESGVKNAVIIELHIWQLGCFATEENANRSIDVILETATSFQGKTAESTERILCQACWALLDIRQKTGINLPESCHRFLAECSGIESGERHLKMMNKSFRLRHESCLARQIIDNHPSNCNNSEEQSVDATNIETSTQEDTIERGTDDIEVAQETLEIQNFDEMADGDKETKTELPDLEEMDFSLSFLDEIVYADLCQGGEAYVPLAMRHPSSVPTAMKTSAGSHNSAGSSWDKTALVTAPYQRSRTRNDTLNSSRSSLTPPGSPCSPTPSLPPAPLLWTAEGRREDEKEEGEGGDNVNSTEIQESKEEQGKAKVDFEAGDATKTLNPQKDSLLEGW